MAFKYDPSQFEYTPEINAQMRESLRRPVQEETAASVGRARGEALRRGLEGDPFEASRVGAAEKAGAEQLSDIDAELAYSGAGMRRQERMVGEEYGRQQETQAQQFAQQEKMAGLQFNYAKELAKFQSRLQRKNAWSMLPGQMLSYGVGAGVGALLK